MECLLMRRLARFFYSLLTATTFHLAACGGDPEPADPIHFAQTTELQRLRAITAGASGDAAMGFFIGAIMTSVPQEQSTCPRITRSGDTLTATGGCTSDSGDRIEGRVVAKNVPGFLGGGNDMSKPAVVTFEDFRMDDSSDDNEDFVFDGTVTLSPDASMTADLHVSMLGLEVWSDATWNRTAERTTARAGSAIELAGLGRATIEGSWNMDSESPAGALELHGTDVLRANFDAVANDCVPLTIDGAPAGQLCEMSDSGDM
jgi:hypothetical protein